MISGSLIPLLAALLAMMQQPPMSSAPVQGPTQPGQYLGVVSCAGSGCHGSPAPVENANVLMNEYDTWVHAGSPSHVRAYEALLLPRSRQIARNLRLPQPAEKSKVCLDCHALNVPEALQAGTVELTDGVSCESCHGPASGWRARHVEEGWTHEDSVRAGMIDLRHLPTRAKTCLACHMGKPGQIVDHELIAAGHPILTFELDNFTESRHVPPHWKEDPADTTHGFRAWAVGQAVTFNESARNAAWIAGDERWPEFAQMSCAGCHHPLREGAWRQERGFTDTAGLPLWGSARWIALRHLVASVAPEEGKALETDVRNLSREIARMRNSTAAAAAARAVSARLDRLVPRIESASWGEREIRDLIRRIAADPAMSSWDRQDAEQATYALVSISNYLVKANPALIRSDLVRNIDSMYRILDRAAYPDEYDRAEFVRALRAVREGA